MVWQWKQVILVPTELRKACMIRDLYITNYTTTCFDMVNTSLHTYIWYLIFKTKEEKKEGEKEKQVDFFCIK